jgi:hypothetical protein
MNLIPQSKQHSQIKAAADNLLRCIDTLVSRREYKRENVFILGQVRLVLLCVCVIVFWLYHCVVSYDGRHIFVFVVGSRSECCRVCCAQSSHVAGGAVWWSLLHQRFSVGRETLLRHQRHTETRVDADFRCTTLDIYHDDTHSRSIQTCLYIFVLQPNPMIVLYR